MPLNWHYLSECEPLTFGRSTFITGINASGKSTMIDAMRLLFFVTTGQFNKANAIAGDRQSRPLASYVRGTVDMTAELQEDDAGHYLREGPTVTHIVAELLDEESGVHTTIGVSVEATAIEESNQMKPVWWTADNCHLGELQFVTTTEKGDRRFAMLDEVKKLTPAGERIRTCGTQREAKMRFSVLFGLTDSRMGDEKALENWARTQDNAIAFNPKGMKNLDQFIKDLVLPKKEIRTDEFRKLLETHHELQQTSDNLNHQCERLKEVVEDCEKYHDLSGQKLRQSIKISLAKSELIEKQINEQQELCDTYDRKVRENRRVKESFEAERDALNVTLAELQASESNEAINRLTILQDRCDKEIEACEMKAEQFASIVSTAKEYAHQVNDLFGSLLVNMAFFEQYRMPRDPREDEEALFIQLAESLKKAQDAVERKQHETHEIKTTSYEHLRALNDEIAELERGLSYPDNPSAAALKNAISAEFKANGILDEPKYLCELLELTDLSWASAAEAFMGGYRFAIIVMPDNYLMAADAYKKLCAENKGIYGVTLVDSTAFRHEVFESVENSMASLFTSANPYARAYIGYAYNHVILVEDAAVPPSKDGTFISKDGMKYARRGFSRMRPVRLVIGAEARKARLGECRDEAEGIEKKYNLAAEQERTCLSIKRFQNQTRQMDELFANGRMLLTDSAQIQQLRERRSKLDRDLKELQSASSKKQIEAIKTDLSRLKQKIVDADNALLSSNTERSKAGEACTTFQNELNSCEDSISDWRAVYPVDFESASAEFKEERVATRKGIKGFCEWLDGHVQAVASEMDALNADIRNRQIEYNRTFDTAYPTLGYASMDAFRESYNTLSSSQIPEIKSKADKAALQTRRCFEEDIMSSLRTAIEDADSMLAGINRYMGRMPYNGNFYRFTKVEPADGRREEYEMIRSKTNTATTDGQTTFDSLSFKDEYAAKRAQLFEAIEKGDEAKNGFDLLDYRAYCKFGVTVSSADDPKQSGKLDTMVSSGSGAEVQVPCYIILTAALVQKYNRANRLKGDISDSKALRIMIIDECFDKLDSGNVQNMISFISKDMGLQLIASAPTDKFPVIGVNMDSILFMKTNKSLRQRDCYFFTAPSFSKLLTGEIGPEAEKESDRLSNFADAEPEAL